MKNIYIAYDGQGSVESVLLAETRDGADLVWLGMGICAANVEEIDILNRELPKVVILLSSVKIRITNISGKVKNTPS